MNEQQGAALPVTLFYSYTHEDEILRNELEKHLSNLMRQGIIASWHDTQIQAGSEWSQTIDDHLNAASVILLLISPDFLASDYCYSTEMQRAMERHDAKEAIVIPVILRHVDWHDTPFSKLQVLPPDGKPIRAWSDRDQAFLTVARGIRAAIEQLCSTSISATMVHTRKVHTAFWHVPYQHNPFFTGRDEVLAQIHGTFNMNQKDISPLPQALCGLGGVGKTQIAIEYAYRYRDEYSAVIWIDADTHATIIDSFSVVADVLQIPEKETQDQKRLIHAIKDWLHVSTGWLLIFDNANDLSLVHQFLPPIGKGHILLTTQEQALGSIAQGIEVVEMPPEMNALFLLRRAALIRLNATLEQISHSQLDRALEIVRELGGLPLAIDQAGAYMQETKCSMSHYLVQYRKRSALLLKQRGRLAFEHPRSVSATLSISFEKVQQVSKAAADLLKLCAYLHPDAIYEEIISKGKARLGPSLRVVAADPTKLDLAISELLKYSLISRNGEVKTLTIHPLVQIVLKDEMKKAEQRKWAVRAIQVLHDAFPKVEFSTRQQCQQYIPHVSAGAQLLEQWHIVSHEAHCLLGRVAGYLSSSQQFTQAESYYKRALAISEQLLGQNHHDVAVCLIDLGNLYETQGKYDQAIEHFQQALVIQEKLMGKEDAHVATTLSRLAWLYEEQGAYDQAESLYLQALAIFDNPKGSKHLVNNRFACLSDYALFHRHQKKYDQARRLYEKVLTEKEQVLGPEHLSTARTLSELALVLEDLHEYTEAESLCQRVLAIKEKILSQVHPDYAKSLEDLAWLFQLQQKYDQAESLYQRALAIKKQSLGENHSDVARCLDHLAHLYYHQAKYDQAKSFYEQALTLRKKILGTEHPIVATTLMHLADNYSKQGNRSQAEQLRQQALAIREKTLNPKHLDIARSLNDLDMQLY